MKKIGEGYYYNVYDLGTDRVVKKLKKTIELFLHIAKVNHYMPTTFVEYRNAIRNLPHIQECYEQIRRRIKNRANIGNPQFGAGIEYEQDKAIVLQEVVAQSSDVEFQTYVEGYIRLVKELWKCGCHESVYNFTINNGLNKNGEVILLDFNEMAFDKDAAARSIKEQRWLKKYSYFSLSNSRKEFYKKRMEEEISIEQLDLLWDIYASQNL